MIAKQFHRLLPRAIRPSHPSEALVPTEPLGSDLYLVAFPKSGITWLSFLLANTNLLLTGDTTRRATFFNINDLVPDIHVSQNLDRPAPSVPPGFRLIKSHSSYTPKYTKVIYLVRNPVHVMASYYAFTTELSWFNGSYSAMIEDKKRGAIAWTSHVLGWIDNVSPGISFSLLKYEDLKRDTPLVLKNLYSLFGFELSDDVMSLALTRSNLANMRDEELRHNRSHPALANFEFVRNAEIAGPRVTTDEQIRQRINHLAKPALEKLGYN